MNKMRVSVLVTFYNQEKYVDKALKSILDQKTNFGIKILVGDDGSTDETCNIVEKWIDLYPNIISLYVMERTDDKHIAGFRASQNRLNLIKHVETEYFIFLDGDDFFDYDEKLQKQVEILDNDSNKDCICCGHDIDMLFPNGDRKAINSINVKEGKYSPEKYWRYYYFHTDTLLFRSSMISSIPFDLVENNFNDNLITFLAIQHGKIYYIPKSWAVYFQTGDGIWTSNKSIINVIRNMFVFDLCNQINKGMKKQTLSRFSQTWMLIYKNRKKINKDELDVFLKEAEEKNLLESYKWINYNELSILSRSFLCIKAFCICWKKLLKSVFLDYKLQ